MQSEDDLIALVTALASSQPPASPGTADLTSSQPPASSSLPSLYLPDSLHPVTDEPSPVSVMEEHKKEIKRRRIEASAGQLSQAERMVKRSHIQCKPGSPGDNVAVPIPSENRARGDPRNILGVVMYRDNRDQYKIAVKYGILKGLYSRNQFDLCPQKLLTLDHDHQEQSISLRSAVIAESSTGGQGFPNAKVPRNARPGDANALKLGYSVIAGVTVA